MARAFAGGDATGLRLVRGEQAFLGVELVDEDVIRPEVGDVGAAVPRMEVDAVGVRAGLTAGVGARADVLERRRSGGEGTVGLDRQRGGRTRPVVDDDQVLAGGVDGEVRRSFALGGFGVQQAELVAFDRISGDGALGGLGGRVEELRVGAERDVRSGLRFGGDGRHRDLPGLAVEQAAEDALGLGAGSADVEDVLRRRGLGLRSGLRSRGGCGGVGGLTADEQGRERGEEEAGGVHRSKIGEAISGHPTSRRAAPGGASRHRDVRRRGRGVRRDRP